MRSALGFCCLSLAASLLQFTANTSTAAVLTVDAANGPYYTVQSALNVAVAGDTVHVKPGVYRERVSFAASGTSTSPIVLEGEPGAILDASNNVTLNWILDAGIGAGVYRAAVTGFTPFTVTANGKIVSAVTESKCDQTTEPYYWPTFFANGFPAYGWAGMKAVVMWHSSSSELYIRFDGALNPNSMSMTVSPRASALIINGKNYCTIRGLTIRNASDGISITNAVGCIVENCVVGPVEWGIKLNTGTQDCKVRNNEVYWNPYFEADPFYEPTGAEAWDVEKKVGESNRMAIRTDTGNLGGHQIHDNYVHDCWDGINTAYNSASTANNDIHHNYIYKSFDQAVKVGGVEVNTKLHDNVMEWGRKGVRISEVTNGPLFVYHNVFLELKSSGLNFYTNSALPPTPEVWVYQNTNTSDDAIYCDWGQYAGTISVANHHFYNNLFWCNRALGKTMSYLPDWTGSDYDIYVRARTGDRPWTSEGNGWGDSAWNTGQSNVNAVPYDAHALWVTTTGAGQTFFVNSNNRDMALSSGSQARTRGLDLTTLYGGALPGAGAGYFTGAQPDVGALQYGEPMARLPRGFASELESTSYTTSDSATVTNDVNANVGQYLLVNSNAANDYVTFTVSVIKAGNYDVKVRGKKYTDRGITSLLIDSVQLGGTWDQYASLATWEEFNFGAKYLTVGSHTFKFQVTSKNASAADYKLALDTLCLAPHVDAIIMDNTDASGVTITGTWTSSMTSHGFGGANYIHDGNASKGSLSVRYTPTIATAGDYEVFARWPIGNTYASNVPIDIAYNGGSTTVTADQQHNSGTWMSLGTYNFAAGTAGNVLIRNTATNGYVIADSVKFVAAPPPPPGVNVEVVTVGNPGNADDTTTNHFDYNGAAGAGGVAYTYSIAKFEITVAQWVTFLNLVDPSGANARGLYNAGMQITNSPGAPAGQHYAAISGKENWACSHISWMDGARLCNYLTSGDTEAGAYNTATAAVDRTAAQQAYPKVYVIPMIDEWYKAAYHKGVGLTGADYNDFPFSGSPAVTKANYNSTYEPDTVCNVGTFPAYPSAYGTFDQGGNLAEWTEEPDPLNSSRRLFLGGCAYRGSGDMECNYERVQYYYTDDYQITLRVACIAGTTPPPPPPPTIGVEYVPVGNVGNADDTTSIHFDYNGAAGAGGVAYDYNISKYEITVSQWVTFLNLVDPSGANSLGLYNTGMQITNTPGAPSGQRYAAISGKENFACNYICWQDGARFCNYLTSGNTEAGAYNTSTWAVDRTTAKATYGKAYAITTIDEWYKAAYHDGLGLAGSNYRDFPFTGSPAVTKANYNATYEPDQLVAVGTFAGYPSAYGTFDQGGNIAEWTEEPDPLNTSLRLFLGGCYTRGSGDMECNYERVQYRYTDDSQIGLRIVELP